MRDDGRKGHTQRDALSVRIILSLSLCGLSRERIDAGVYAGGKVAIKILRKWYHVAVSERRLFWYYARA